MIANIVKPGSNTHGVLKYLFDKGRANEHTDQHTVASWDDFIPDPGPWDSPGHKQRLGQVTKALDLRVVQAGDKAPRGVCVALLGTRRARGSHPHRRRVGDHRPPRTSRDGHRAEG